MVNLPRDKMSQEGVYNFLLKNRGQCFSANQLTEELGLRKTSITKNIRQLVKYESDVVAMYQDIPIQSKYRGDISYTSIKHVKQVMIK